MRDANTFASMSSSATKPVNNLRLLAICGVIVPILFTIIVIILGLLRPGYSHVSQAISELGEVGAPNAAVQDANFVVFGLLVIAFAVGLHRGIGDGRGSKIGPALVGSFGAVGAIGAGIFPLPSPLHVPVSLIGFISLIIATLVISRRLKQDARWQSYRSYSLITGGIALALFVALVFGGSNDSPYFGALQRIFLTPLFLWVELMAIHLLRLSNQPKAQT